MAMSQSAPTSDRVKNLKCAICHEVFQHPKLLSCLHTFCQRCLEDLAKTDGSQNFSCPTCHKTIEIPPEGVQDFADNPYITEMELQRERLWSSNVMCSIHTDELLKYFCIEAECDIPICLSCKLTEHFHHTTEDLSKVANRNKQRLPSELDRLELCIQNMSSISQLAKGNLKAARDKAELLKERVHHQHSMMVAQATKLRDKVLEGLTDVSRSIDQELSDDVQKATGALDSLLALHTRLKNAAVDGKVHDVEVVAVDKEMRKGQGSVVQLATLSASKPFETARPGLLSFTGNLRESLEIDVLIYLGSPVKLLVPNRENSDVIRPVYSCGSQDMVQEIHSIYRTDDGSLHVAYGGKPPAFAEEKVVHLDRSGVKVREHYVRRKINFDKSYRTFTYSPVPAAFFKDIKANSNGEFRIKTSQKTTIQGKMRNGPNFRPVDFEIKAASKPHGFDVNASGSLFVVINEEEASDTAEEASRREHNRRKTEKAEHAKSVVRTVRLYRRNLSDPVATYQSSLQHFFPTAVTFWNTARQELILIADFMNDCVHVVCVHMADFQFFRFLQASGCGDIVRPTALEVDKEGIIWIGCETGWLLQCQPFTADIPDPEQADDEPEVFLNVAIPSPRHSMD